MVSVIPTDGRFTEDTEDQGDHGSQRQSHPEVSHPVVQGGHGHSVGEDALQAHKQQPCRKRHTGTHIMERFGVINLSDRKTNVSYQLEDLSQLSQVSCMFLAFS